MDEIRTCPLGSTCYEIKDNRIHRCAWHIKLSGKDAQGNEHDDWGCAMAWMPILQVEMSSTNRGQTQAIESLRNETVKRMDTQLKQQQVALSSMRLLDAKVITN
jgi:hypothetical protein